MLEAIQTLSSIVFSTALILAAIIFVRNFGWKRYEYGEITVSDGDGLRLGTTTRTFGRGPANLRLDGFDAPEWNQPGGAEASAYLNRLIKGGVKIKRVGTCVYGRPVVAAKVPGTLFGMRMWRDVAVIMCAQGHGHTTSSFLTPRGFAMLRARIMHRGLWKNAGLFGHRAVDPKYWRKADGADQLRRRNIYGTTSGYGISTAKKVRQTAPRFKPKRAFFPGDLK